MMMMTFDPLDDLSLVICHVSHVSFSASASTLLVVGEALLCRRPSHYCHRPTTTTATSTTTTTATTTTATTI